VRARSAFIVLAVVVAAGPAAAAVEVSQCGVTVPPGEKGVLQNDIVCENRCSNDPSILCYDDDELCPGLGLCLAETIVLGPGSRLDLDGHQILMAYQGVGVRCGEASDVGSCTIVGPGNIIGGKGTGVLSPSMDLKVKNVIIDNTDDAILGGGFVDLVDVRAGFREDMISGASGVRARRVRVGPAGIQTLGNLVLLDVEIDIHSGFVFADGWIRGRNVSAVGYGLISGYDVALKRLTSLPEAEPPLDELITVEAVRRLRLTDSNAGTIESGERPKLSNSSCLESVVAGSSGTWGVCAND
jgi:hypothetical protein